MLWQTDSRVAPMFTPCVIPSPCTWAGCDVPLTNKIWQTLWDVTSVLLLHTCMFYIHTYIHTYVHIQLYLARCRQDSPAGPEEAISYNVHCTWKGPRGWEPWTASRSWGLRSHYSNELNSAKPRELGRGPWTPNENCSLVNALTAVSKILS